MLPALHFLAEGGIPEKVIREEGFANWIVYALVALYIIREARSWLVPARREVSGEVSMKEVPQHADKEELATVKTNFEAEVKALHSVINELKLSTASASAAQVQAAMKREASIKDSFRTEAAALGERLVAKMETLTKDAFQVINQHGERLAKLETISKTWRD